MEYIIAFVGGILTFISPCILPLIPIFIAYMSGLSVNELKGDNTDKPTLRIFSHSLFFVVGFTLVFSLLAALFYLFLTALGSYKIWFNRVAGLIIVIFGLHLARIIQIPFLNYEVKVNKQFKGKSFTGSFLMGVAFGAGWTPCIGPILSGILFSSSSSSNAFVAVSQLVVYSLGLGIPFILTGLLTSRFLVFFEAIKKHYRVIELIAGLFLVLLGIVVFMNWMGLLSGFFSRLFPGLSTVENIFIK